MLPASGVVPPLGFCLATKSFTACLLRGPTSWSVAMSVHALSLPARSGMRAP
jgi:hypothetical protein